MPYISQETRAALDAGRPPQTPGELNYALSMFIDEYLKNKGPVRYAGINEVIGVLECAKLELYRRIASPYEDHQKARTGEVYNHAAGDVYLQTGI